MSTFAQSLNYLDLKRKSVGSRSYRINISPRNGGTHQGGANVQFQLPTVARSYVDLRQAYIKFKCKMTTAANAILDKNVYSLVNRYQTSVAGTVIDEISQFNVLIHTLTDLGVSLGSLLGFPQQCLGNGGDPCMPNRGVVMTNADQTFVMPLPPIGVAGCERLLPLDVAEGLVLTFFLETAANAFIKGGTNAAPTDPVNYELSELELIIPVTELSAESQNLLDQGLGDSGYTMNIDGVNHTATTRAANATNENTNLGFRYSSLSAIMTTMRLSVNNNTFEQLSLSNRCTGKLQTYQVNIGGQKYPQKQIKCDDANKSEVLAELLVMKNVLNDDLHQMSINQLPVCDFADLDNLASGAGGVAIVGAIQKGLVGSETTADEGRKFGAEGDIITPTSSFNLEEPTLPAVGISGLTRRTHGESVGSFVVATDLDTFKSNGENLYNNLNTIGQQVTAEMTFGAGALQVIVDHYGFYNAVLIVDPVTRAFEVSY